MTEDSKNQQEKTTEERCRISRRNLLIAGGLGLVATLLNKWNYKNITIKSPDDFDVQKMRADLSLLEDMMLREGEDYRVLPDPLEDSIDVTIDEVTYEIFPRIVQATNDFLDLEETKLPEIKGQVIDGIHDLGMSNMLDYVLLNVYAATRPKGTYVLRDHALYIDTPEEINAVKGTIAHEYVHALVRNKFLTMYNLPRWVYEGFAEALSKKVIEHGNLFTTATRNGFTGRSLGSLINAYKGMCEELEIEPSIPEYLEEMDLPVGRSDYSFGYAFFRIREKQLGAGIYRQILEEKSLQAVEPLPVK